MIDEKLFTPEQCFPHVPRKSQVTVTQDDRIAVYIGSAYQYLTFDEACTLNNQLVRAIHDLQDCLAMPENHS